MYEITSSAMTTLSLKEDYERKRISFLLKSILWHLYLFEKDTNRMVS